MRLVHHRSPRRSGWRQTEGCAALPSFLLHGEDVFEQQADVGLGLVRLVLAGQLRVRIQLAALVLSWEPSGFSVHAGEVIEATQPESLERMARYATRAPIALARVFVQKDGRVELLTPVHPKTGKDYVIFDPLDWVHAVTTQIPDAKQHLVRCQGAYANVVRAHYRSEVGETQQGEEKTAVPAEAGDSVSTWQAQRRRSWARLLGRIYEVDPLHCPCGGVLRVVSVITDPVVVDRILAHRKAKKLKSPFAARAPPAA